MKAGQFAFRVRPAKKVSLVDPVDALEHEAPIVHSRKAHSKSRGGCVECKQRRKKCDEKKPACSRCVARNVGCTYAGKKRAVQRPETMEPSIVTVSLWPGSLAPAVLTQSGKVQYTPKDLSLLHHFIQTMGHSIAGLQYSDVFTVQVLDLAKEVPFLMHAMLALSACHLAHTCFDGRDYRLPEAFHTQMASEGLRGACIQMRNVKDMDSVLTTSMLLNCLAFCYADFHDDNIVRTKPSYQWLRIALGLKELIIESRPFHRDSMWNPMFKATDTWVWTDEPQNDLDLQLAEFCNITLTAAEDDNPYLEFYTQVAPLVVRESDTKYIRMYSVAAGGIDGRFINLLEREDPKALILFVNWLGIMVTCITWWVTRRVSTECWLICHILDRKLRGKDRLLLQKPAAACGYPLDIESPTNSPHHLPRTLLLDSNLRYLA